ncbi:hypothetical protein OC834_005240 [Tilletia horrida]|nr:hypothetical protein OC834_005240 [Tilletia horrida]
MGDIEKYCKDLKGRLSRALDANLYKTEVHALIDDHLSMFRKQSLLYEAAQASAYASQRTITHLRDELHQHQNKANEKALFDLLERLHSDLQENTRAAQEAYDQVNHQLKLRLQEAMQALAKDNEVRTADDFTFSCQRRRRHPLPTSNKDSPIALPVLLSTAAIGYHLLVASSLSASALSSPALHAAATYTLATAAVAPASLPSSLATAATSYRITADQSSRAAPHCNRLVLLFVASKMPALQSRPTRFITHLCISVDVVLGDSTIVDSVVRATAHLLNRKDSPDEAILTLWARVAPEGGAYLITGAAFGTSPLTLHVNEPSSMRLIPEEVDGSIDGNPTLAAVDAFVFCLGVLKSVSADKKSGVVGGFVFLGKTDGWVEFELHIFFEDTARWQSWSLPGPRTLVYLDAVLDRVDEDGKVFCALRRIFAVEPAPQQLLTALKIGQSSSGSTSKASLILGARQRNSAKTNSSAQPTAASASGTNDNADADVNAKTI